MEKRVIAILGCTASGKSGLARALASELGAEIVSVDSMKVYRGLDIGTAKPSAAQLSEIPHHLIDVAHPWEAFSAARFVDLADAAIDDIHRRGRPAMVVGGTMLYFRCLYEGIFAGPSADADLRREIRARAEREGGARLYDELTRVDPDAARKIHPNDLRRVERALEVHRLTGTPISALQKQWRESRGDDSGSCAGSGVPAGELRRPDWRWVLIGLRHERESANRRINERVRRMVAEGLVEEARRAWSDPRGVSMQAAQAVGYAELFAHFRGEISLDEAIEKIKINSRRLAKHQRTWLKRVAGVQWIDPGTGEGTQTVLEALRIIAAAV